MDVRPATRSDLPAILDIYNEAVLNTTASYDYEPQSLVERLAWFDDHTRTGYPVFVAEDRDDRIVGWSSLSEFRPRIGYRFTAEDSVYVRADQRGKGIGTLLLPPLINEARRMCVRTVLAVIGDADNEASIRLHARCGFQTVGIVRQVGYKFDRWLDQVWMQLLL